jgi:uncharacterized protein YegL
MKENSTRIVIILDRSGSMVVCREGTVTGFNKFIADQKKQAGDVQIKLVQFNLEYKVVFDKRLEDVSELTQETFFPEGLTALHDALGKTITELGTELARAKEGDRPARVLVVTITDGEENSSKEYTRKSVFDLIEHQKTKYNWEFVFIGANQDAIASGEDIGLTRSSCLTGNCSDPARYEATWDSVSNLASRYRTTGQAEFTEQERAASA